MCQLTILFNQYTEQNYDHLLKVSRNVSRRNYNKDNMIHYSLLSEVLLMCQSKLLKNNSYLASSTDFIKYITSNIKNYYNWNVIHGAEKLITNNVLPFRLHNEIIFNQNEDSFFENNKNITTDFCDEDYLDTFFIDIEFMSENNKEFVRETIREKNKLEDKLKYNDILEYVKTLTLDEQILFKLHFVEERKVVDIYRSINSKLPKSISYDRLLIMCRNLKKKIRNEFNYN